MPAVPATRRRAHSSARCWRISPPETSIEDVDASDPAIAVRLRFAGSPTIWIDGVDVDPGFADPADYTPRCRLYWTPAGVRGAPLREWIEVAVRRSMTAT